MEKFDQFFFGEKGGFCQKKILIFLKKKRGKKEN